MKLSNQNEMELLAEKQYIMDIEDEIHSLHSVIKSLRRNAAEDNCYILALEEAIDDAKACFHAGESTSDMYNALTRTEIKTK
jgi:hypothetical protein